MGPWARTVFGRGLLLIPLLASACRTATPAVPPFGEHASFALDRVELAGLPAVLAKVDASRSAYFRMLAEPFAARTCAHFADLRWQLPVVAVHGDAHIQQFAVTATSYGLEDYDHGGYGAAVVDLVRFAASLQLLCQEVEWPCDADAAVSAYFAAYRAAIDRPMVRTSTPAVVLRMRQRSVDERAEWLAWVDSIMRPLAAPDARLMDQRWSRFVRQAVELRPETTPEFYAIVRTGSLHTGLGSSFTRKWLVRVQGASLAPDDDVVLEVRLADPPTGRECVWRPVHGGAMQTLLFMSILGPRLPDIYGLADLDGTPGSPEVWVQAWDPSYRELATGDVESQAELEEVAVSAAVQLAGHFWTRFPAPLRMLQRTAQLEAFDRVEARARSLARALADEAVAAWTAFRSP